MRKLLFYFILFTGMITMPAAAQKPLVVSSFTIVADIAKNIGKDTIQVVSIAKPGADVHDYQPTPKDIARTQNAQLILWNGLNLERWFSRFLQDMENVESVVVSKGVKPISIYKGKYKDKPNPHAWMSVTNAIIYVDNITKALIKIAPEHASFYEQNATDYKAQLIQIKTEMSQRLAAVPEDQRILVSSEGAFSYLTKDFNMKELYLWPINAELQGTPQQVRDVILEVRQKNIPVVFSESTVSDKPMKQVAKESGAQYGGVLYVDSLSVKGGPVQSFLDLLRVTANTIATGFESNL